MPPPPPTDETLPMEQSDWSECYNHGTSTILSFGGDIESSVPWDLAKN